MPNRLANEQSPYLLQHANNPVDWYPWGAEAFEAARASGKPIFLSIGYATCHWCHVMERESFENEGVAKVLNDLFVSIKVDREERPDVDRVYMTFVQATTGSGGWPMSVWLTPDLQPFFGGTYFPPSSQWGRPGFVDVLTEIGRAWREDRLKVVKSAAEIVDRLALLARGQDDRRTPGEDALDQDAQPVSAVVRHASRRFWRRAEVSASERVVVPAAGVRAHRQRRRAGHGGANAQGDGARRHARSHRRRLSSLLGRRQLAGAALREDALRPGADRAGVPRGVASRR